jgi:hypothetical protein
MILKITWEIYNISKKNPYKGRLKINCKIGTSNEIIPIQIQIS